MKNCVSTYKNSVKNGKCYIYSLRVGDKRCKSLVTIELRKMKEEHEDYDFYILQARAKCNGKLSDEQEQIVKKWCKANRIARKEPVKPVAERQIDMSAANNNTYTPTTVPVGTGTVWVTSAASTTTTVDFNMGTAAWTGTIAINTSSD